jgi:hypothetical protein
MARILFLAVLFLTVNARCLLAADYALLVEKTVPPKQLAEAVAKELEPTALQVTQNGDVVCTVWLRKEIPSVGTAAQAKNGLTYKEFKEGTFFGAIEIVKAGFTDYRKQKIPAGVYTLRLAIQPMDGDHMGTAPYNDFLLLSPADADKNVAAIENEKALVELSAKTTKSGHPAVLLLFPGKPTTPPKLVKQKEPENHWTIDAQIEALVEKKPYGAGISLTIVGQTQG